MKLKEPKNQAEALGIVFTATSSNLVRIVNLEINHTPHIGVRHGK